MHQSLVSPYKGAVSVRRGGARRQKLGHVLAVYMLKMEIKVIFAAPLPFCADPKTA